MAAVTEASLDQGSRQIIQRYFLAMAAPFAIDVGTSAIYVLINDQPMTLLPMASVSALFLLLGVGVLGWMLSTWATWGEQADRADMREWIDNTRIFRKTLAELVREYVELLLDGSPGPDHANRLKIGRAHV